MSRLYLALLIVVAVFCGAAGSFIGYHWDGTKPVPEDVTAAPVVTQKDGSIIVERQAAPAKPTKPPHQLPKGAKEERRFSVTVQPKKADCPPVSLDLSLVQVDGGRRVVASSPDGEVIAAQDMPIEAAFIAPKPRLWAAGISSDVERERYGVWLERDVGRIRAGVEVIQDGWDVEGRIRLGITF